MTRDVEAAFENYMSAFESLELDRIVPCFDTQSALITAAGTMAMPDHDAVRKALGPLIEQLRTQSYDRTDVRERIIKMLSPDVAQLSAVLTRYDSGGGVIGRFGVVYTMRHAVGAWKIATIVMHHAA